MNVEKIYNDKELTIKVDNQIDTVTAPDFENEINNEMGKFDSLILDFENLEYISSAGLRVLIMTQKKLQPHSIPFTIINSPDMIKDIIKVSGLDNILDIQ
ncbi:MAG: STAS domain-containing protein [Methanobrevibacter millerae]|uniref:STAS domain-containing protein n=1 Tax=Methanobrevibacter millerae TaxID=230361 RepID=A0A8T3VCT9_9EURY|nr:STAS domain-containing protein [Methanobrevibacter millerae]MBE6505557.1 STAS domain-containing protein [Methanobrevibacter millerae]